jgi:hypothetical protein
MGFLLIDKRSLIDIGIVLICFVSNPSSSQLLKGLPLEIKLGFDVNDLINELQVGDIKEVGVGLMPRGDGKDLPIEFTLYYRSDVVVRPSMAFQFGEFSAFELFLEAGVVHLVGNLE